MRKIFDGPVAISSEVGAFSSERSPSPNRRLPSAVCRTAVSAKFRKPRTLPAFSFATNSSHPVVTPADLTLGRGARHRLAVEIVGRHHATFTRQARPQAGEQNTATTHEYQRCGDIAQANSFGAITEKSRTFG